MPAKTYGVICTKGGVGKTTVTAFTGALVANMGQRVLLVDADSQQRLSRVYPISVKSPIILPIEYTNDVEKLLEMDSHWLAPALWRSKFRNILALYIRKTHRF